MSSWNSAPQGLAEQQHLIAVAREGDQEAWQSLVEQSSPILRGFIRSRVKPEDVDDVLQDAWTRIFQAMHRYNPDRGPWIAFCRWYTTNTVIDSMRRKRAKGAEVLARDVAQAHDNGDPLEWLGASATSENDTVVEILSALVSSREREQIYLHFLRLAFSLPNPPHELVCFSFVKLLEWEPRRIVSELGPNLMNLLEKQLERDFGIASGLRVVAIDECFAPLRQRLILRLGTLLKDLRARKRYECLLERVVGTTCLREYFSANASGDISHWWSGVRRSLVEKAASERTQVVDSILQELT